MELGHGGYERLPVGSANIADLALKVRRKSAPEGIDVPVECAIKLS